MEENKSKKINLVTIILILLLVLSMVIVGIALYKMNESNVKIAELNKEIVNIKNQNNNESNISALNNTETNYTEFATNFEKELKKLNNNDSSVIERKVFVNHEDEGAKFGYYGAYVDENNNAYIILKKDSTLNQKYGNIYKVDEDVLNVFVAYNGNGGFSDFIFIKKDGTADKVSTTNGTEIKCEKIKGVKNAVTVVPYSDEDKEYGTGGYSYLILDIDGNIVNK